MKLNLAKRALLTAGLLAVAACGNDGAGGGATSNGPALPEAMQKRIDKAMATAKEGEKSPTMACTSVVAMVAGSPLAADVPADPDNVRAFELCYVDVGVAYIKALLARFEPGVGADSSANICERVASYAVISRASIGSFAKNIHLDVATLDGRIHEAVRSEMTTKCPDWLDSLRQ